MMALSCDEVSSTTVSLPIMKLKRENSAEEEAELGRAVGTTLLRSDFSSSSSSFSSLAFLLHQKMPWGFSHTSSLCSPIGREGFQQPAEGSPKRSQTGLNTIKKVLSAVLLKQFECPLIQNCFPFKCAQDGDTVVAGVFWACVVCGRILEAEDPVPARPEHAELRRANPAGDIVFRKKSPHVGAASDLDN
jgi:hypothetical protein